MKCVLYTASFTIASAGRCDVQSIERVLRVVTHCPLYRGHRSGDQGQVYEIGA